MNLALTFASSTSLGEGALYSLVGFIIVLVVLALLVGIFYLSGLVFQSKLFNKKEKTVPVTEQKSSESDETDEQLVAVITAAVACMLEEETGEAPEFVIKRIVRKK